MRNTDRIPPPGTIVLDDGWTVKLDTQWYHIYNPSGEEAAQAFDFSEVTDKLTELRGSAAGWL